MDDSVASPFPELPSFHDVVRQFSLFDTNCTGCNTQIGEGGSLRCDCHGCTDWQAFLRGKAPYSGGAQYEVFTREHLRGLASYIRDRVKVYNLSVMNVLEVGAGNGRLAYHLGLLLASSQGMEQEEAVIHLTATDKGLAGVDSVGVRQEDAAGALLRVHPQMVLVSWMPMGVDWTAHIRATDSVLEYILIGETDDGICGDPWLTWGFDPLADTSEASNGSGEEADDKVGDTCYSKFTGVDNLIAHPRVGAYGEARAPYCGSTVVWDTQSERHASFQDVQAVVDYPTPNGTMSAVLGEACAPTSQEDATADHWVREGATKTWKVYGWEGVEIPELSRYQICRTDERWSVTKHSHTVSFRR